MRARARSHTVALRLYFVNVLSFEPVLEMTEANHLKHELTHQLKECLMCLRKNIAELCAYFRI